MKVGALSRSTIAHLSALTPNLSEIRASAQSSPLPPPDVQAAANVSPHAPALPAASSESNLFDLQRTTRRLHFKSPTDDRSPLLTELSIARTQYGDHEMSKAKSNPRVRQHRIQEVHLYGVDYLS